MALKFDPENNQLVQDYVAEDGTPGMYVMDMAAIAARMALLGLDDPEQVFDMFVAEAQMDYGREESPYGVIYEAIELERQREAEREAERERLAEEALMAEEARLEQERQVRLGLGEVEALEQGVYTRLTDGVTARPMMRTMMFSASASEPEPEVEVKLTPETVSEFPVIAQAQSAVRQAMAPEIGPKPAATAEVLEGVRADMGPKLQALKAQFLEQMLRT